MMTESVIENMSRFSSLEQTSFIQTKKACFSQTFCFASFGYDHDFSLNIEKQRIQCPFSFNSLYIVNPFYLTGICAFHKNNLAIFSVPLFILPLVSFDHDRIPANYESTYI